MDRLSGLYFDLKNIFKLEGLAHIYVTDLDNNIVLACNPLQMEMIKIASGRKETDIIGTSIADLFHNATDFVNVITQENILVVQSKLPKQFCNIWLINNCYKLELLTTKIPLYNADGEVAAIFGISQYLNKFSAAKAFELGLSKRETQCLFYLLEGKSNKQIANVLNLSVRTVEDYLNHTKDKLGCFSKEELVIMALKTKLLDGISEDMNLLNNTIITSKEIYGSSKMLFKSTLEID